MAVRWTGVRESPMEPHVYVNGPAYSLKWANTPGVSPLQAIGAVAELKK